MLRDARAVLFDLDDTIVEVAIHQGRAWNEACGFAAEQRPGLDPLRLAERIRLTADRYYESPAGHRHFLRDSQSARTEMVRRALVAVGARDAPGALASAIADRYCTLRDSRVAPVDGAVTLLEALRAAGTSTALVTNGPANGQRQKIAQFDLARHFDHIQIEGEFGAGKPDASVYPAALAALGVAPAAATFVGDNLEWDVAAPMRAGMQAVWVDATGDGIPDGHAARPRRVVRSVAELQDEL